ncbi:MAG: acyltransferase [Bacteroidota bacterium]
MFKLIKLLLNNKFYYLRLSISKRFWYIYLKPLSLLKGVKIGKNISFHGYTFFYLDKAAIIQLGNNCTIRSSSTSNMIGINRPCMFSAHHHAILKIGDNCGFSGTVIGAFSSIIIGDNVMCGANTLITDSDWHSEDKRSGENKEVVIENNVWIGEGVKVLKGVRIGNNSLIGSGSIVTNDIPANVIAAGNPCRVIKKIT